MGRIGHLDVYGVSTEYLIPNTLHVNAGLALAPDGSLWYGQAGLMRFGVMAPPGVGPSKLQTTTTLSVSPSPAGSAAITCVATVTSPGGGTPTGFVIFSTFGGRVPLTNGTATAVLIASPSLQAGYCGDANYFGSLSQPAFLKPGLPSSRVANISFANSTTGVNTPTESTGSTFNVFTTMSAANFLTGGTPSGTVTIIMDDTNTLGNGTLSTGTNQFTVSGYGPGQHYLQAFYNGDANFDPIASVKLGFVGVAPSVLSATTTLSLSTNQAQAGQVVTLTATVTGAGEPESVVDFLDGTNLVGRANLHGGVATLSYVFAPGSHSLTAHYEGDFSFNTANSSASGLSVNGGTSSPPQLLFVSSPGAFVVSWPASASGFVLEENTNLGVSGWTAVGITPTTVNNQFTVTNSTTTQPAGFFRLRK
jgi:hypothetical protein